MLRHYKGSTVAASTIGAQQSCAVQGRAKARPYNTPVGCNVRQYGLVGGDFGEAVGTDYGG